MNTFGDRFKEERKKQKLTQEQLANMFHLQKSSISRYENNKQIPEIEILSKIADFFGVTTDYLLCRSDNKTTNVTNFMDQIDISELDDTEEDILELLKKYVKLDKEDRKKIESFIDLSLSIKEKE